MCLVNPWITPRGLPYILIIYLLCSFQRTMLIYSYMNLRVFADLSKPNNVGYCTKYSAKVST